MNEIEIFTNPAFGEVRTLTIDSKPYFVGKDVAEILGYQNGSRDINRHIDDEDKLNDKTALSLGQRVGWFISAND